MNVKKCPAASLLPRGKKGRVQAIHELLTLLYPEAECALDFKGDPFRLLVMARLSAQCTDKRVNEVSVSLFKKYPDAEAFARAEIAELEEAVKPCGLYRTKAAQILEMSKLLVRDYAGEVPSSKNALLALPGVGEKIANLMMGDVFGDPHIVADTHMIRLSGRFGLTNSVNPAIVTRDLEKIVPKAEQADFCHRMIFLGREYCKAQNPNCSQCPFMKK
ncbi:MAG: endonuclease III [Ruminococcaceae bacterium]|nr:endonuclease III [Oscillospiraceae bacterium]